MPMTTTVRIIIALAGQIDRPVPPPPYPLVYQTIHLWELPSADSGAFALRVAEGNHSSQAQLSPAESEQLTTLLAQLPAHSMVAGTRSFDGAAYELIVMRAEEPLSFYWQNDDWRYAPQCPLDEWERVAGLADYALMLAKKQG